MRLQQIMWAQAGADRLLEAITVLGTKDTSFPDACALGFRDIQYSGDMGMGGRLDQGIWLKLNRDP